MNRRVLVIEPDPTTRRMMELALSSAGFAPTCAATMDASRALLDEQPMLLAVAELRASNEEGMAGLEALRAERPTLPLVVTGTMLTPRVMQALMRLRVDDVLPKPFTPRELAGSVERVLAHRKSEQEGALDYAAAMAAARRAILDGRPEGAEGPLARARAAAALDAEAMALLGLCREVVGEDHDAESAYRAALSLGDDRITEDVDPREGLARLAAYDGARVVPSYEPRERHTIWAVSDPRRELPLGPPGAEHVDVVVIPLGLGGPDGHAYARLHRDGRLFVLPTSSVSEELGRRLLRWFAHPHEGGLRPPIPPGGSPSHATLREPRVIGYEDALERYGVKQASSPFPEQAEERRRP